MEIEIVPLVVVVVVVVVVECVAMVCPSKFKLFLYQCTVRDVAFHFEPANKIKSLVTVCANSLLFVIGTDATDWQAGGRSRRSL